jgi:hypothetical protein
VIDRRHVDTQKCSSLCTYVRSQQRCDRSHRRTAILSEASAHTQQRTRRAQVCDCAVIDSSAFDRTKGRSIALSQAEFPESKTDYENA